MTQLEIHQFMCLKDNYGVLIHDKEAGVTAAIDAPEAEPVRRAARDKGWKLTHILVTHHHGDHTAGIEPLKAEAGCTVLGPEREAGRIKGLDRTVTGGQKFTLGRSEVHVINTPGHTSGHVTYWIPSVGAAFVGDTLFAIGCGRVVEGDARMMWTSLGRIAKLPASTAIYCGHEYTLANAKFALAIEPENQALQARAKEVEMLCAEGRFTLPTRVDLELATNPFLRPHVAAIRKRLGMEAAEDWQVFGEIRERKNRS